MKDYNVDLLDGFDGREIVYDEKKEKSYQARIWWALFIAAALILLRGATFHIEEQKLVKNGQQIIANYNEATGQAYYTDENGAYHHYDLAGMSVEHDDKTIVMYYETEMAYANPAQELSFWLKMYLFFGGAMILCGWRLWKIYKG